MDLDTRDMLKKKILDCQENVRDFQMFSKRIESNGTSEDREVAKTFKEFAEDSAMQARKLKEFLES
ncbi:hypothetical protein [Hathewaya massiliensis]|uniref:hypothetical protein n=1 Tax=Hathewaya massiliensis TaxID=1964382 RepID=UPI0011579103|nr:hypothetical protein [Hathewaya massiliensis]